MSVLERGFIIFYTILLLFGVLLKSEAQSFSEITKGKAPLSVGGYFNAELLSNTIHGLERRSDPLSYRLNGLLSFSVRGWKTDASFHISTSRKAYSIQYPGVRIPGYALIGISPEYRWIKLHLGNRYMHFSDYSFSNHSFYGGGIELSPGTFRFSAFYGRLKRENASNAGLRQSLDPTFKRMGWGV